VRYSSRFLKDIEMKVTINLKDEIYQDLKIAAKNNDSTISDEVEKAIVMMLKKRALIRKIMKETINEYDEVMKKLAG